MNPLINIVKNINNKCDQIIPNSLLYIQHPKILKSFKPFPKFLIPTKE